MYLNCASGPKRPEGFGQIDYLGGSIRPLLHVLELLGGLSRLFWVSAVPALLEPSFLKNFRE
jgi:hypothetical protein